MNKKELYQKVIDYFEKTMPEVETELNYSNPFQLLVAVVLSAQCTDKRVNTVTSSLFQAHPTPESMSKASESEIYNYIKSISYPNNKSKHLTKLSKILVSDYDGEVPENMEDLLKLPGVGRKTANVIQSVLWHKAAFAVDTHIFRVSHRLGLVDSKCTTPLAVEKELTKFFPDELIPTAHHWLLLHGRYICQSRKAKCNVCGLSNICKSAIKFKK